MPQVDQSAGARRCRRPIVLVRRRAAMFRVVEQRGREEGRCVAQPMWCAPSVVRRQYRLEYGFRDARVDGCASLPWFHRWPGAGGDWGVGGRWIRPWIRSWEPGRGLAGWI
jgi:hypothetical protein